MEYRDAKEIFRQSTAEEQEQKSLAEVEEQESFVTLLLRRVRVAVRAFLSKVEVEEMGLGDTLTGILQADEGAVGVVNVGDNLSYVDHALDTVQDIRTTALPSFAGLTLSSLASGLLSVNGSGVVGVAEKGTAYPGLDYANVFTSAQKINVNSSAAFLVENDGVQDDTLLVNTATGFVTVRKLHIGPLSSSIDGVSEFYTDIYSDTDWVRGGQI